MSRTYCHTHSAYDCQTCADEILSLGIQVDKDRIKWLESEVARLEACAARTVPEAYSEIFASRCPMCSYQHGHQIGCENNPIDIALRASAAAPKKEVKK